MSKKKSTGVDGLSKDKMIMRLGVLVLTLTQVINSSIEDGEFPKIWKEALVAFPKVRRSSKNEISEQ
jgi:hypothetical protein